MSWQRIESQFGHDVPWESLVANLAAVSLLVSGICIVNIILVAVTEPAARSAFVSISLHARRLHRGRTRKLGRRQAPVPLNWGLESDLTRFTPGPASREFLYVVIITGIIPTCSTGS